MTGGRVAGRSGLAVVLFALGVAEALGGVLAHQTTLGLVLAVAAPLATVIALPGGFSTRLAFALGWITGQFYFVSSRGEGDFLVSADAHGRVLQYFGFLLVLIASATLRPWRRPDAG